MFASEVRGYTGLVYLSFLKDVGIVEMTLLISSPVAVVATGKRRERLLKLTPDAYLEREMHETLSPQWSERFRQTFQSSFATFRRFQRERFLRRFSPHLIRALQQHFPVAFAIISVASSPRFSTTLLSSFLTLSQHSQRFSTIRSLLATLSKDFAKQVFHFHNGSFTVRA